MSTGKCNIARSVWRTVEILLFFVISVVGFNVFFKATSLNSKSKVKSLSRGLVAPRELSVPQITLSLLYDVDRLSVFFSSPHRENHSSLSSNSADLPYHQLQKLNHFDTHNSIIDLSTLSFQHKPANLIQQNPVLLI
ncbi:MAG: hypothetical protein WCK85_03805 [Chlorobium sp.]